MPEPGSVRCRTRQLALVLAALAVLPRGDGARAAVPDSLALLPVHLDLDLAIDYVDAAVAGRATWTIRNVGSAPIGTIPLQLGRLMRASDVRVDARGARFTQAVEIYADWPRMQVNQIRIALAEPLDPGGSIDVSVVYAGPLVPYAETGMRYVRDDVDPAFTILRAEAFAFPQVRAPSLLALREMPRGDVTFAARITVPEGLVVATGRSETSRHVAHDGATVTWTFASADPVPFIYFAIAPYELLEEGDLRVYHFPADSAGARAVLAAMTDAIATYTDAYGPIEREMRLHVIEIPEGWGSQAHLVAGIIQTADAFRSAAELDQLYHELAHLWHPADADPAPPRWNEGLATFLALRMKHRGHPGALDSAFVELASRQVKRFANAVPDGDLAMLNYGREEATDLSYGTGALMFYALYRTMGAEAFDRALAAWMRAYRATGSTSEQFTASMQAGTDADLATVFRDWLETAGWYDRLAGGDTLAEIVANDP